VIQMSEKLKEYELIKTCQYNTPGFFGFFSWHVSYRTLEKIVETFYISPYCVCAQHHMFAIFFPEGEIRTGIF
jgi:hypothetical protein